MESRISWCFQCLVKKYITNGDKKILRVMMWVERYLNSVRLAQYYYFGPLCRPHCSFLYKHYHIYKIWQNIKRRALENNIFLTRVYRQLFVRAADVIRYKPLLLGIPYVRSSYKTMYFCFGDIISTLPRTHFNKEVFRHI